jgi:hypothetical protein
MIEGSDKSQAKKGHAAGGGMGSVAAARIGHIMAKSKQTTAA